LSDFFDQWEQWLQGIDRDRQRAAQVDDSDDEKEPERSDVGAVQSGALEEPTAA
jgi:hypothetical protein